MKGGGKRDNSEEKYEELSQDPPKAWKDQQILHFHYSVNYFPVTFGSQS